MTQKKDKEQNVLPGCEEYGLKKYGRPIRVTQSLWRCPECNGTSVIVLRHGDKLVPGRRHRLCQRCGYEFFTQETICE